MKKNPKFSFLGTFLNRIFTFILTFFLTVALLTNCSDNSGDNSSGGTVDPNLFVPENAENATIPLVLGYQWNFKISPVAPGIEGKPDKPIKELLLDNAIIDMKILPVREFDDNSGNGKYIYQALCYITESGLAFFSMNDRIYIGKYLSPDNYGFESVTWEFELPKSYSENSSRYFALNRNASFDDPNRNENFLYELPGFDTVDIEIAENDVKRYKDCKKFVYYNAKIKPDDNPQKNVFYFSAGKGLIKYQQFLELVSGSDTTLLPLFEQVLVEPK